MKRHLIAIAALGAAVTAQAAPNIVAVTGTLTNDGLAVIAGTGFGTNLNLADQEWLGGTTGIVDAATNGTRIDQMGLAGWSMLQPSTATYPHITTERAWSNGKSIAFDTRGTTEYKQTLFYDTGSSGYSNLYTNALIYLDYDPLLSGSHLQWKIMRWYKVADVLDHAQNLSGAYMTNWFGGDMVAAFTGWNTNQGQYVHWFNADGWKNLPDKGAWYRYETWLRMNSSPGTADGKFRVRVTNPSTGAVICDNSQTNVIFNGSGDSGNFRYVVLQNYFGNASDGNSSMPDNAHAVAFWDDIYIAKTEARVETCSQSTYAACTNREIQPATVWTDAAVTVKLNRGNKSDMGTSYLYVTDANGNTNANGFRLASGGKQPSAPNGVVVP